MYNKVGQVIYIGKAKNLKNRIKSYFQPNHTNPKITALIIEIDNIDITITNNEIEALLLENKLINQLKPKYNVIFRDDKSYPYIALTQDQYPSIRYFRSKNNKNNYTLYGPYPSSKAVKTSLDLLTKIFKLRTCNNNWFNNRTKPCLEFQLKRCSAPCVKLITEELYAKDVANVKLFLEDRSRLIIKNLTKQMHIESNTKNYEMAAILRDQISALSLLQHKQTVLNKKSINLDVLGIAVSNQLACVHLLHIRNGNILYSKQFFSKKTVATFDYTVHQFLEEFILQHYIKYSGTVISSILTSIELNNLISEAINIKIYCAKKGDKLAWQNIAQISAEEALSTRVSEIRLQKNNFKKLTDLLGRDSKNLINRIACFDVSHTYGKETIAACVVFNNHGKEQSSYRLFNIKLNNPSDDYQALRQAISRYMEQVVKKVNLAPDLLIVDGGKGQLNVAEQVLDQFKPKISNLVINLLGIAKGLDRKFGLEKIYLSSKGAELHLQSVNPVFKLLLNIRDEAHRFAIKAHRKQRDKIK
jgi:excinuclease ABC subunit C